MRTGLTSEEELQVRRLRFERVIERGYSSDASESGRLRLRSVFAIGYLLIAAYNLEQIRITMVPATWDSLILRLGLPALPLLASCSRLLTRYVMALTAFGWIVVVGSLLWVGPRTPTLNDFTDKALIQVIVASCAVVLIRMPAYLVAFCGYSLFAFFGWSIHRFDLMLTAEDRELHFNLNRLAVELFSGLTIFVVGSYFTETIERRGFLTRRLLAEERLKTHKLIANMLPQSITDRLLESPEVIAESHADVTVMFADVVDFTPYAATHPASEVVTLLNSLFSKFDLIVEREGIEKIKTIGDAYMAAAGLPEFRPDHVEKILDVSLEMLEVAHAMDVDLRIGIQVGPVMAGVIGTKKYLYDLWGDTVNVASRMETRGLPGKIQVMQAVVERARDKYEFEERGSIEIKGLGHVTTSFLIGKRSGSQSA